MRFSLKVLESSTQIQQSILKSLVSILNKNFSQASQNIATRLKKMVKEAIEAEPEYQSLMSGQLRDELGIPDPGNRVNTIVNAWANNVNVNLKPVTINGSRITGNISIGMIKEDYSDVLGLSEAIITDRSTGSSIPWLYWLLLGGGDILVKDYEIKIGPSKRSRTGNAVMVKSKKDWRMPSKFVGVAGNNWVYRAISRLDSTIEQMMQSELEKTL